MAKPKPPTTSMSAPGRVRALRALKWTGLAVLVGAALAAVGLALLFWWYGRNGLPQIEKLSDYHPPQVTVVTDRAGQRIGEIYAPDGRRTYVPFEKIPKLVVDAFIAAEDQSYWEHSGIDYWGMLRALLANLRSGGAKKQGASTITQQVVKTFLLSPEKTMRRKVQEIILARRLENNLSKAEILTLYLNQIYLGHGRYGIVEAARYYFGKEIFQLTAGDAAVLAALPKSPTNISPRTHPQRAKERQIYVLRNLAALGKITQAEAQKWIDAPIALVKEPYPFLDAAPEIVDLVRKELAEQKGPAAMATLGGKVQVTIDPAVQRAAQHALQKALRGVDKRQKIGVKRRHVVEANIESELAKFAKRRTGAPKPHKEYPALVLAVSDAPAQLTVDAGNWKAIVMLDDKNDARYNPPNADGARAKPSARFARGDEVVVVALPDAQVDVHGDGQDGSEPAAASAALAPANAVPAASTRAAKAASEAASVARSPAAGGRKVPHRAELAGGPQGAVVVLDIATRNVRAMVGGYASVAGGFNRATMAKRQPGSSFKPIVYAAAMQAGLATPARVVADAPEVYDLWKPQNYNKGTFEGPVRLRYALAKSINTVAIRVCHEVGTDKVRALAAALGIASELPGELSLALGSGEVTPLEMANVMATLAGGGVYLPPRFVDKINGATLPTVAGKPALAPELAYVITDMMRSVIEEGTGHRAKAVGVPVAGKTGTSNDARDVWFIGATADYAIAVWIGNDNNDSMGGETGGQTAVPVFVDVVKALAPSKKPFARPPGVVSVNIDKATGLLAAPGAPAKSFYSEVFVPGTAPTEVAPLPGEVTTNTLVTGEYDE